MPGIEGNIIHQTFAEEEWHELVEELRLQYEAGELDIGQDF